MNSIIANIIWGRALGFVFGDLDNPGVHVTIVCVAHYEHPDLPNEDYLQGAVLSAERLVDFWQSSQLPDNRELGSISFFLSCSSTMETRFKVHASPAEYAPVIAHLEALIAREEPGDMAVLHWIGHGSAFGNDAGELRGVYFADAQHHPNGSDPRGLSASHVLRAFSRQSAMPLLMTVDACATPPNVKFDAFATPLGSSANGTPSRVLGLFAAAYPEPAICTRKDIEVENGVTGGALFSEAVRIALEGFGAEKRGNRPPIVHSEGLVQAVIHHHRRLLKKREYTYSGPTTDGQRFDRRWPISKPLKPRSAVLFCSDTIGDGSYKDYECRVGGQLLGSGCLSADWDGDERVWEVHLAQDYEIVEDSYNACLYSGNASGAASYFSAVIPLPEVDLEMPS